MVPGIRPSGSAANDQKRAMTPREAMQLGATSLVVGRPIYQAADPRAAAEAIAREAGVEAAMTVAAKICGLSTAETVDAAVAAGARFVGFVTYPRSPRHVASNDLLAALGARVPQDAWSASACSSIPTMRCSTSGSAPARSTSCSCMAPRPPSASRPSGRARASR